MITTKTLYQVTHFVRYTHHDSDVGRVADVHGYRIGGENRNPILLATVPERQMPKVGPWDLDAALDGSDFDGSDFE